LSACKFHKNKKHDNPHANFLNQKSMKIPHRVHITCEQAISYNDN